MMLATSLNMHRDTLIVLTRAAVRMRISRREIIVRLLMRVMCEVDAYRRDHCNVAYQGDNTDKKWHCFPIKFNNDEREFFTDLRKICKCSVSLLVAIAVEKYLVDMISETIKGVYKNVRFNCHEIKKEIQCGLVCWQIHWGHPGEGRKRRLE
jgi:hypothetical protein